MVDPVSSRRSGCTARTVPRALGALLALWAASAGPVWALGTFTRHLTITVGSGVVGGPLTNFPVLVDVMNADLRTTGNLGSVQSAAGYDIVFRGQDTTTCGGAATCMLDHEIELYDGAAGRVLAWVRVPSLVASTTVIHMYYGNNLITSPTETPGAVFDADYVGVWHLKESGNGTLNEYRDSSRYGNHGQGGQGAANATPARVASKIGDGQRWDKATDNIADFIDVGQDGSLNITGNQITLEGWVNHDVTLTYSNGTASVAAGGTVVTVSGGSLPGWVGPNDWIDFASPFESIQIASRDSAMQLTLSWGAGSAHTNDTYTIRATQPYGIVNHKGYYDGYRLYLDADSSACPNPSGALTDPCAGFAVPGNSDQLRSSQYGSPAKDPVTRGEWHHLVGSYDNTEMKLYVDGQKVLAAGGGGSHLLDDGSCLSPGVHCGSVAAGTNTVTFDTALPGSVKAGDVLIFDGSRGGTAENFLVTNPITATSVTISPPAAYNHTTANGSYRITSPFKTGNLMPSLAEQHVWIGHADQPQNVGWSSPWVGDLDEVRISRVARSAGWIQTEYNNQNNPGGFYAVAGPVGVTQSLPTFTTVYRSIGTNAAVLAGSGGSDRASAALGSQVVTFTGTALPANVGQGDQLAFTAPVETLYVLSRDSDTQVTVQTPAGSAHASQTYTIKRAYTSLAVWETALPASLVTANVRQVGVAYKDGPLGRVTFSGSTTDPLRSIVLTTAVADRTRGTQGSGVVLNNGANVSPAISIWDEDVTIERFEITGGGGTSGAPGIEIDDTAANQVVVRNCLIHDIPEDGITLANANSTVDIYDNFIYGTEAGIRLVKDMSANARVSIFNNTIYNNRTAGVASRDYVGAGGGRVHQTSPRVTLRNNILHTNTAVDQDVARSFDSAYFCLGLSGNDPTTCSQNRGHYSQPGYDNTLDFGSASRCIYLGANDPFRGVAVSLAVAGTNDPDLQWSYWNGSAWASLETGSFEDYNFQGNGFAYWPDDPPDWATRLIDVDSTARYWVRACVASGSFGTLPVESLITRADVSVSSRYNLATDFTGYHASLWHGVGLTGLQDTGGTGILFNSATDLHIQAGSMARDAIVDASRQDGGWESSALTTRFLLDIDYQARPPGPNGACTSKGATCWDIGADEWASTTEVALQSFSAVPGDGSVTLEWQTGSELDNLGFNLYRGLSADGPWTRLTSSLIPGLGSSPLGQAYSWLDSGLANGTTYYYRLEDVDTSSRSTFHGPVSATPGTEPVPEPSPPGEGGGDGGGGDGSEREDPSTPSCPPWVLAAAPDAVSPTCTRHGEPDSVSLQLLSRDASGATLELHTGGFWALRETADEGQGTVRVFVPGLELPSDPKAPALPLRRALVDAVVGRGVELVSAEALDLQSFRALRPSAVGAAEVAVGRDGTLRAARRALAAPLLTRGTLPRQVARLVGTVFQGDRKSAVVEITPVRFSGAGLVLAGRVRVRLAFTGLAPGESGTASRGRARPRERTSSRDVLAQLHTSRRGPHAVRFEELFPQGSRALPTGLLRLQRQGEAVAFHVEPQGSVFGPGSTLFFDAERTASSSDYSPEVAYELVRSSGVRMATLAAAPVGAPVEASSTGFASFETNRIYQPGLLEAKELWFWEYLASGAMRTETFALPGLATGTGEPARLTLYLQGGSESGRAVDHHVEISVKGTGVGETSFAGKRPQRVDLEVPSSLLEEGANELALVNVADTGVSSRVYLDRFEVSYPQASTVRAGVFEGVWAQSGTVEVRGLSGVPVILRACGAEGSAPLWLTGFEAAAGTVRFQAEAGYRYLVVTPEGLLTPRVARVAPSTLTDRLNQADYLVIAPRSLLEAASPLLERRRSQGLSSRGVAFEEIASQFGHGQESAEAIHAFLSYAYHSWRPPSPRYVLLLGDATDDPQRFLSTSHSSPLPALLTKTSYLWTVSDPALAAVNGEDALPDLAIGRLPATTREEADTLVAKVLAWEESGQGLSGTAVFVADTPDAGGDFEADAEDVRASFLADRTTETLRVRELGAAAKGAILEAFDQGSSLMSYVGHGGTAVWSSSGVLTSWDAPLLRAQSRQPMLLTMNCLNGYFVAPNLDALPEALLKAEGRGAIAAFSPSGLSLDGPAHEYHRALVQELASASHARLGDAVLAAQKTYAQSGLMPELLTVYQLLGDPAMRLR